MINNDDSRKSLTDSKAGSLHDSWGKLCLSELSAKEVNTPKSEGLKRDNGKNQAGLLVDFSRALLAVTEVGTFGTNKYSRGNWLFVDNAQERYTDAMYRHLLSESIDSVDSESGLLHAAHAAWNALARLELMLRDKTEKPVATEDELGKMHDRIKGAYNK